MRITKKLLTNKLKAMTKTETIKEHCKQLKLTALSAHLENTIAEAEKNQTSYLELVKMLMEKEI